MYESDDLNFESNDLDDEAKPKKRSLRFRWPIYSIHSNDPLMLRLKEFQERDPKNIKTKTKKNYIVSIFVRDSEGNEYNAKVPSFFRNYNFKKPSVFQKLLKRKIKSD